MSKKATVDAKSDPAIAMVGAEIGNAFREVVRQRKDVGARMASALESVKTRQANVLPTVEATDAEKKTLVAEIFAAARAEKKRRAWDFVE